MTYTVSSGTLNPTQLKFSDAKNLGEIPTRSPNGDAK